MKLSLLLFLTGITFNEEVFAEIKVISNVILSQDIPEAASCLKDQLKAIVALGQSAEISGPSIEKSWTEKGKEDEAAIILIFDIFGKPAKNYRIELLSTEGAGWQYFGYNDGNQVEKIGATAANVKTLASVFVSDQVVPDPANANFIGQINLGPCSKLLQGER